MRRSLVLVLPLLLVTAACGGDSAATSTTEAPSTSEQPVTPPESSTSSTTEALTTTTVEEDGLQFAITEVNFTTGMVKISNVGTETATLSGYSLCQRPSYFTLPDTQLAPGESVEFEDAALGGFDPTSGELGLYSSGSFSNPDDIVSYVEWGRSGHGRSSVAVEAGIWPDASFVVTSEETISIISAEPPATSPDGWFIEAGDV